MKAFSLNSQGSVERVAIANPGKVNLTAYAVGTPHTLYVTIINKTHSTTHDAADVEANLVVPGFSAADPAALVLTDGDPGNAAGMTATLGGDIIRNDSPWHGRWTELSDVRGGKLTFSVRGTAALVVLMEADGKSATTRGNQEDRREGNRLYSENPVWVRSGEAGFWAEAFGPACVRLAQGTANSAQ